jgi:hypothetical protein
MTETTGLDEELAATQQKLRGQNSSVFEELVRLSIVEVDGQKVEQPFTDWDKWNSRTRAYVLAAFRSINGVEDNERADFLASARPAAT